MNRNSHTHFVYVLSPSLRIIIFQAQFVFHVQFTVNHRRHGAKAWTGPWDLGPRNPATRDPGFFSNFKIGTRNPTKVGTPVPPSKFKKVTLGPLPKFKSGTLEISPSYNEFIFFQNNLSFFSSLIFSFLK